MESSREYLKELLIGLRAGEVDLDRVMEAIGAPPYHDLGFAKVDHHRVFRKGFQEVVYGEGKSREQIAAIAKSLLERSDTLLVTRVSKSVYQGLKKDIPDSTYHEEARAMVVDRRKSRPTRAPVAVVTGGTADIPVAEEAAITAHLMGCRVERLYDVGVAGVHRLLDGLPTLEPARAIVVVAGMDGALPSVVGGLTKAPVIGVPTSVGYGASFGGVAPLLTMLNTCAPGVSVVNIDNGFGAGYLAAVISLQGSPRED